MKPSNLKEIGDGQGSIVPKKTTRQNIRALGHSKSQSPPASKETLKQVAQILASSYGYATKSSSKTGKTGRRVAQKNNKQPPTLAVPKNLPRIKEQNPVLQHTSSLERATSLGYENYVQGCANVYLICGGFFPSTLYTMTQLLWHMGKERDLRFYYAGFLTGPISYGSLLFCIFLQPRNHSLSHRTVLFVLYGITCILPDLIEFISGPRSPYFMIEAAFRLSFGVCIFCFCLRCRRRVARLPDKRLSRFLTDSLLTPAISGTCVLLFFALDPIRCWLENADDIMVCRRTLFGQAGLSCILITYEIGYILLRAIFPAKVRDRFTIPFFKLATGDLTLRELAKSVIMSAVVCCSFFLFAQYNSRAAMSESEVRFLGTVGIFGTGLLMTLSIYEFHSMATLSEDEEDQEEGNEQSSCNQTPVLKLCLFWRVLGVLSTTSQVLLGVISVLVDPQHKAVQHIMIPFAGLSFVIAFVGDPRNVRAAFEKALFATWVCADLPILVLDISESHTMGLIGFPCKLFGWLALYKYGQKFRSKVAAKIDSDLSKFLQGALLKTSLTNLSGMMFVIFKSLNCVLETGSLAACANSTACSMFISIYLTFHTLIKVLSEAMTDQERKRHTQTWEQVATLNNIRPIIVIENSFNIITTMCGMFLFCLMESSPERTGEATLWNVGMFGIATIVAAFLLRVRAFTEIPIENKELNLGETETQTETVIVTEMSHYWQIVALITTLAFNCLAATQAVNPRGNSKMYGQLAVPLVGTVFIASFVMKPRRKDRRYLNFLNAHFFQFAVVSWIPIIIAEVRIGEKFTAIAVGLIIVTFMCIFPIAKMLRTRVIGQADDKQLSNFLVNGVLVRGSAVLTTELFLLFEAVACLLEEEDKTMCRNTIEVASFASILAILMAIFILSKWIVPREVKQRMDLTKERLARFSLTKVETFQCGLLGLIGMCAINLLSSLGLAVPYTYTTLYTGIAAIISGLLLLVTEAITILGSLSKINGLQATRSKTNTGTEPPSKFQTTSLSIGYQSDRSLFKDIRTSTAADLI